jgi:hypothetical protein
MECWKKEKTGMIEYWNVGKKEDLNNGRIVIGERSHTIKLGGMKNGLVIEEG